MEKKLLTREEQTIDWLRSELEKDKKSLEIEKLRMIESLKNFKKDEIVIKKEKLTLWKRVKKVLMGF
jgi:hypothetical protein